MGKIMKALENLFSGPRNKVSYGPRTQSFRKSWIFKSLTRGLSKIEVEKYLVNSANNLKLIWNKMLKTTTRITEIFQKVNYKNSKSTTLT